LNLKILVESSKFFIFAELILKWLVTPTFIH
jgi:hypothetical protein